jgi:hypothetical protein
VMSKTSPFAQFSAMLVRSTVNNYRLRVS